jgi:UDP-MurNAc hydroxylase
MAVLLVDWPLASGSWPLPPLRGVRNASTGRCYYAALSNGDRRMVSWVCRPWGSLVTYEGTEACTIDENAQPLLEGDYSLQILFLGHAGLMVETEAGSILCDPWFNPAYFGSWWPFPANDHLDFARLAHPTYLYISHLHQDHFDPEFLLQHVDKSTTVLLPAYPLPALREALERLGFRRFIEMPDGEVVPLAGGLKAAIWALTAPGDGPLGDSCLFIDDGATKVLNLNDARPRDLDGLASVGPVDALFLQFSGAIWYPLVYELDPEVKADLARAKRTGGMQRAETFIRMLNPRFVFPSAGPPAFLDEAFFAWNDLHNEETNPFPDQTVFLQRLAEDGIANGELVLPGTTVTFADGDLSVRHHLSGETVESIFGRKMDYLRRYQARMAGRLAAERASWPAPAPDLFDRLKSRLEPIMAVADLTARQIGGDIVLDWGTGSARLDFRRRRVLPWEGSPVRYYFRVEAPVLAACLDRGLEDWVNALFLSFRFTARREGEYNEAVYTFFKCLSPERIQYAEGYWMETHAEDELWECGNYLVQRRCPHLKADLKRFGVLDKNGVLTCQMHGWQFDLATGRCLNADNRTLYRRSLDPAGSR